MNPIQSLYYVSPACAAFLALPFVVVELPDILANTALVINYPMLLLNAITAFGLNLAVFLLIGKTSALTMNIAGVIKDWMLIFASQHLFGNSVSFLNYLGCAKTSTLHPSPYTLHPTLYTLHPTPYTLHPTPYTLHPYILNPKTLNQ